MTSVVALAAPPGSSSTIAQVPRPESSDAVSSAAPPCEGAWAVDGLAAAYQGLYGRPRPLPPCSRPAPVLLCSRPAPVPLPPRPRPAETHIPSRVAGGHFLACLDTQMGV